MNKSELIESLYKYIMERKIKEANDLIDYMVNNKIYTRSTILSNVKKYGSKHHQNNMKEFYKNYRFFIYQKYDYLKKISSMVEKLIDGEDIILPEKSYKFLNYLKIYVEKFPEYKPVIDKVIENLTNELDFLDINQDFVVNKYEYEFMQLLKSKNPVELFRKFNWNIETFYYKLDLFKNRYISKADIEHANYLEQKYQEYLQLYKRNRNTKKDLPKDLLPLELIEDLFNSNCSVYEYCDKNYQIYTVGEINKFIKQFYGIKGIEIIKKLNNKENPNFQSKLNNIALNIINNPNYTIIDYYLETKLRLSDFYSRVENRREIAVFVSANSKKTFTNSHNYVSYFNKNEELKAKNIIKGKEITIEEKNSIFKFLEDNGIPVDQFTYRACLNKLVDNSLEFMQKIKTYKGSF